MDCTEIRVEMAEEELLERLVITEEGEVTEGVTDRGTTSGESALKKEEEHTGGDENEEDMASEMCLEKQSVETQQTAAEDDETEEVFVTEEDKQERNVNDGQNSEREGQTHVMLRNNGKPEKPSDTEDRKVDPKDPKVDFLRVFSSLQQPEGTDNEDEDSKKAHRLTPDFPEALYELLCTLQEGRRLNDQRCSFRMESGMRRRRCHSEPNAIKPANRVMFSSMTSLQKEEFFELVATAQARRLDDQRALLEKSQPQKRRGFRGSIKQLSFVKRPVPAPVPVPVPVPKEDLYNMILTTQAQGRLEDQRSRAPGPMDDEDFFSLLLRVQGGRMEEQRTELPCMLQT